MSKEAVAPNTPTKAARGLPMWWKLMIAVLSLPLVGVLLPTVVVLGACMLPSLVAVLFDRTRERCLVITIGLMNLSGALLPVFDLWAGGHSFTAVGITLSNPVTYLYAFGSAGLGLGIYLAMPQIIKAYYASASNTRVRALRRYQEQLVESWGDELIETAAKERKKG